MAIKGKRKGRSRPRGVAAAPRPFLVPPRTPPLRRRPVQVFLIALVLGGFVALGAGLRASQNAEERRDAVEQFGAQIDAAFTTSGIVQSFGATPIVLPEMQAAFQELQKPKIDPEALQSDAGRWQQDLGALADQVGRLNAGSEGLKQGRELIRQALELFVAVAAEIEVAATLDADAREAIVQPLQQQMQLAQSFFNMGWSALMTERELVGIPTAPAVPGPQQGFPQQGFPQP